MLPSANAGASTRMPASSMMPQGALRSPSPVIIGMADGKVPEFTCRLL